MKLAYVTGPGNVVGTWRHWSEGREDPGVAVRPYSRMFYDLFRDLDAQALVLHSFPGEGDVDDGRLRLERLSNPAQAGRLGRRRLGGEIAKRIEAFAPDAAVINASAPLSALGQLPRDLPVFVSIHRTFWPMRRLPTGTKDRIKLALLKRALARSDGALCTSRECARQYRALRGADVPCLVERPVLNAPAPLKPAVERPRARHLAYAGRVTRDKGVFLLLDAFERLAPARPELTLSFAGDGEALAPLRERIAASPVSDRIEALGRLPAEGVLDLMTRADLLVCPTLSDFTEGLALVCIEAAAVGTPSLMSSVVPAQDLLSGACQTFEADSADALFAALAQLTDDGPAYASLVDGARSCAPRFRDPSQCWGEQLRRLLAEI